MAIREQTSPEPPVYTDVWYSLTCDEAKSRLDVAFFAYNLMEAALEDELDINEWCIGISYVNNRDLKICRYNITQPVRLADPDRAKIQCRIPMIDPAKRIPGEAQVGDFHPHPNGSLPSERDAIPHSEVTEVFIYGQRDYPDVAYIRFVSPRRTAAGARRKMYLIDATTGQALKNGDGVPVPRMSVPKLKLYVEAQKVPARAKR